MSWPRAHWLVGLVTLVLFVSAGVYMRYVILVPQMGDAPRMIFRSRFLFLLLAALANFAMSGVRPTGVVQKAASALILAAPLPLIASFLFDAGRGVRPPRLQRFRGAGHGPCLGGLRIGAEGRRLHRRRDPGDDLDAR